MKWLVTGDWQTKFSTLDASRRAHAQELKIIEKYDIKGHIDLGDLKDDFNPVDVDVVKFQQERKEAIHQAVIHDITIMGNHDMLGQYDAGKNWFSLFDSISGHNVQVPQILELGKCAFACLPFHRSQKKLIESARWLYRESRKIKDKKHILLFHCDVKGASWNNVVPFRSESKVTLQKLHYDFYAMCFGGHIHKYQTLANNAIFVGNPFCADAGEIDQRKGFIVYDDESDSIARISSVVPGLYSWKYVKEHKPTLVAGTKIKATVSCALNEDYHKKLDKVASAIERKYPDCISYVVPQFQSAETKEVVEVNPDASDVDKILQYVKLTVPDNLRKQRKALVSYIANVLGRASHTGVRQAGKIVFENIVANNTLSFKDVNFSFRNRGIVLVKGQNKDWEGHSNGSGKTNLLSLLPIALAGTTFKEQKNDSWANDNNPDKAKVTLDMTDDKNRKLTVIRQRRPMKLKFLINGKDESIGRKHIGKKETQGRIEETIGYTLDTLSNSVYIDSTISNAFLTGTTAERAKLIHQFQNMDRFKLAKDIIVKEISKTTQQIQEQEHQKETAREVLKEIEEHIAINKQKQKAQIKKFRDKKIDTAKNYKMLKSSFKKLFHTSKALEAKIDKKAADIYAKLEPIDKQISIIEGQLSEKEREEKKYTSLANLDKCPKCGQKLSTVHRKKLIDSLKIDIAKLQASYTTLSVQSEELNKQEEALRSPQAKIQNELAKLDKLVLASKIKMTNALLEYTEVKEDIEKEISDVKTSSVKRHKHLQIIKRAKRLIQNSHDDIVFLKYAQEAMSREGLPLFMNKLLCPVLNKAADSYSELFVDKEIQVVFDVEEGHIVPNVINTHGGKTINAQSTGEKAWAGIITAFALREIANPTNLLVLDEPGHGLDAESAKMFGRRLSRLKNRIETILVVSHNVDICLALDSSNTVTVTKKNNVSTLK